MSNYVFIRQFIEALMKFDIITFDHRKTTNCLITCFFVGFFFVFCFFFVCLMMKKKMLCRDTRKIPKCAATLAMFS